MCAIFDNCQLYKNQTKPASKKRAKPDFHSFTQTKFSVISYTVSASGSQSEVYHKQHEGIHKQLEVFN